MDFFVPGVRGNPRSARGRIAVIEKETFVCTNTENASIIFRDRCLERGGKKKEIDQFSLIRCDSVGN